MSTPFDQIALALSAPRASGKTHSLIVNAPPNATILCYGKQNAADVMAIATKIGRTDLSAVVPHEGWRPSKGPYIVDHFAVETWLLMANARDQDLRDFRAQVAKGEMVVKLRPIDDYHEDMGPVLWWYVKDGKIEEAPYCGHPNCLGHTVEAETTMRWQNANGVQEVNKVFREQVGGWPGYHTHFSPLPTPEIPK